MVQKLAHKARKTPSSVHPPAPPEIPLQVEHMYYSVDSALLEKSTSGLGGNVVTSQILYKPGILAMARVIFEGTRWKIYHERDVVRVVPFPEISQLCDWEGSLIRRWDNSRARSDAEGVAFYIVNASYDFSQERFDQLQDEFVQHLTSSETLELEYNP